MNETKIYHAVHDQHGNIKSIFVTTSSTGGREMMTPGQGHSVTRLNLEDDKILGEFNLAEDDANFIRHLMNHYRVDPESAGSLVRKVADQKESS